jgi:protocatechuate 3,4-dioxygenase, alpha subunit
VTVPGLTPFQTVGPYFHLGLHDGLRADSAATGTTAVTISGRLLDGAGRGIPDGVLECWAPGRVAIARAFTDADGRYRLTATRPPARRVPDGTMHAPHFEVRVLGRGILTECLTRVYFGGEPANASDPVLRLVPEVRRATLIAVAAATDEYHLDVVVQGEGETVFFDV